MSLGRIAGTMVRSGGVREVPAALSTAKEQARRRALNLYRSWYRQLPYILMDFDVPVDLPKCRARLREIFTANKNIKDLRVIDMIIAKGQMELRETMEVWKQKTHFMAYFRDTQEKKPTDFLSKFLDGQS